jgi:hypothetical protein
VPESFASSSLGALSASDFDIAMTELGMPGGFNCTEEGDNRSPKDYLEAVMDPDYICGGGHAPTVFGRLEGELEVLGILADKLSFDALGIPEAQDFVLTSDDLEHLEPEEEVPVVITRLTDNERFDVSIVVEAFNFVGYFRNRDGVINLYGYEDCRAIDNDCEGEVRAIRWNNFHLDTNDQVLSYEYGTSQSGGAAAESNRILGIGDATYLIHFTTSDLGEEDKIITVHMPEGADSEQMTVSLDLSSETESFGTILCVEAWLSGHGWGLYRRGRHRFGRSDDWGWHG